MQRLRKQFALGGVLIIDDLYTFIECHRMKKIPKSQGFFNLFF